jgi:hypothetical protein
MMTPDKELLGPTRTCSAVLVGSLAMFFLISCPSALADSTASTSGTIFDPSGAVAGTTVVLRDAELWVTRVHVRFQ